MRFISLHVSCKIEVSIGAKYNVDAILHVKDQELPETKAVLCKQVKPETTVWQRIPILQSSTSDHIHTTAITVRV